MRIETTRNKSGALAVTTGPKVLATTLLELVQKVQDFTRSDHETVAAITDLINSGRVVLTGSFAGTQSEGGQSFSLYRLNTSAILGLACPCLILLGCNGTGPRERVKPLSTDSLSVKIEYISPSTQKYKFSMQCRELEKTRADDL